MTYKNIPSTSAIDFESDVASGRIAGMSVVNVYGKNSDVDTGTVPEDIWDGGGVYTGFPTGAAETLQVLSSSANDAAAGSGARTVYIVGLDANYAYQAEAVTLNGITAVATSGLYLRVNRAYVLTSGSSNQAFNDGAITVRHSSTTSNVFGVMAAGTNQSYSSNYTIPSGYTGYVRRVHGSIRGSASASSDHSIWYREYGKSPRLLRPYVITFGIKLDDNILGGLILPEKTDVIIRSTSASANNLDIFAGYDLYLQQN